MALWLAVDELEFRGSFAVASGWLQRAERLLAGLEPGPEHGWLAFHEGYVAHAQGDTARRRARAEGGRARPPLRRARPRDARPRARGRHARRVRARGRRHAAARRGDRPALEGGAANPISGAWTFCFLVSACTAVLDFERASAWCDRIAEFAERYGSRMMLALLPRRVRRRAPLARPLGRRRGDARGLDRGLHAVAAGDARRPAGGLARAAPAPGPPARGGGLCARAEGRRAPSCAEARLALDRGDAREAVELAERRCGSCRSTAAVARPGARAARARGRVPRPRAGGRHAGLAARGRAIVGTAPLGACADLAEGGSPPPAAITTGARAARGRRRLPPRGRAPFEAAQARLELAAPRRARPPRRRGRERPRRRSGCASSARRPRRRCPSSRRASARCWRSSPRGSPTA